LGYTLIPLNYILECSLSKVIDSVLIAYFVLEFISRTYIWSGEVAKILVDLLSSLGSLEILWSSFDETDSQRQEIRKFLEYCRTREELKTAVGEDVMAEVRRMWKEVVPS